MSTTARAVPRGLEKMIWNACRKGKEIGDKGDWENTSDQGGVGQSMSLCSKASKKKPRMGSGKRKKRREKAGRCHSWSIN